MIRKEIRSIPYIRLCIPFGLGIIAAFEWNYADNPVIPLSFILSGISCILFIYLLCGFLIKNFTFKLYNGVCVYLILFGTGFLLSYQHYQYSGSHHFSKHDQKYLLLEVDDEPRKGPKYMRFKGRVLSNENGEKLQGNLMVYLLPSDSLHISYGSRIQLPAKYSEIPAQKNPGGFNYKRYLAVNNIFHQSYPKISEVHTIAYQAGFSIEAYSVQLCKKLISILREELSDDEAYNMCAALILGYRAELSEELMRIYSDTGTIHILSVSGLHVGIIYIVLNIIVSFILPGRRTRLLKVVLLIAFVWFYALLTGLSPSVCRSATMLSFTTVGINFKRRSNAFNLLAASAFFLLSINPFYIFDIGFILSYLAVAGILYFQKGIYELLRFKNNWVDKIWLMAAVSIAAQLSTFLMSVYYFHKFPNYFLFANILVIPLSGIILYAGMALLFVAFIPFLSDLIAYLLMYSIRLMNNILDFFASLPFATSDQLFFDGKEVLILYLFCITLFIYITQKKTKYLRYSLALFSILTAYGFCQNIYRRINPELSIYHSNSNRLISWFDGDTLYIFHKNPLASGDSVLIQNASYGYRSKAMIPIQSDGNYSQVKLKYPCLQMGNQRILLLENKIDTSLLKIFKPHILISDNVYPSHLKLIASLAPGAHILTSAYTNAENYIKLLGMSNNPLYSTYLSGAYRIKIKRIDSKNVPLQKLEPMKKAIFLNTLLLLLVVQTTVFAQKKFNEGTIVYSISVDAAELGMMAAMMPSEMTMKIKGNFSRTEMEAPMMGKTIAINNSKNNTGVMLMDLMDKKFALTIDEKFMKSQMGKMPDYSITETIQTKEILGYTCKKVVLTDKQTLDEMTVYYTEEIPYHGTAMTSQLQTIKGMPMEYTTTMQGVSMSIKVKSIVAEKLSDELFKQPAEYKIVTQEQLMQAMMGGDTN